MNQPLSLSHPRRDRWVHVAAIALIATAGCAAGAKPHVAGHEDHARESHAGHAAPAHAEGANPVQIEMHLLTEALSTAPASFAAGDLRPLEHRLHAVHAAKEKTGAAIANGSYRPPKNAGALARFEELDRTFHAILEKLAEHAAKNEIVPAAGAYGQVLAACNGCHTEFAQPR